MATDTDVKVGQLWALLLDYPTPGQQHVVIVVEAGSRYSRYSTLCRVVIDGFGPSVGYKVGDRVKEDFGAGNWRLIQDVE